MAVKRRLSHVGDPHYGLPPGAKVYIDGDALATVVQFWPEGSTSQLGPHYSVRFQGGPEGEIVRVHPSRVGVVSKAKASIRSRNY